MPAASNIYECTVMHQRLRPKRHGFSYRVFYLWLDLDEIDALDADLALFSRNRFNLFSFHDRDHLGGGHENVKTGVLAESSRHAASTPAHRLDQDARLSARAWLRLQSGHVLLRVRG
jgi:DUF1365 family protein